MMTAAANQRKPNYLPRPPILRKTFHKDSRLTRSHILIYQLCRVHSKVISTTLKSNLYNLLMRLCQDMSLQSRYVKCHRYRLIKSVKCTWLHLKKKKNVMQNCLVKNLLEVCHRSITVWLELSRD